MGKREAMMTGLPMGISLGDAVTVTGRVKGAYNGCLLVETLNRSEYWIDPDDAVLGAAEGDAAGLAAGMGKEAVHA